MVGTRLCSGHTNSLLPPIRIGLMYLINNWGTSPHVPIRSGGTALWLAKWRSVLLHKISFKIWFKSQRFISYFRRLMHFLPLITLANISKRLQKSCSSKINFLKVKSLELKFINPEKTTKNFVSPCEKLGCRRCRFRGFISANFITAIL